VSERSATGVRPGARPVSAAHPGAPRMLHHVTYVTYDSEATAKFYVEVMGMPLVCTVMDDHLASTNLQTPYFHTFFRMGDGSTIAFFESPGLVDPAPLPDPAFDNFIHLAMEVPSKEDVDAWHRWLKGHDLDVALVDHGIIYSIYFHDPNGVRLEITTSVDPTWNEDEAGAEVALAEWVKVKAEARATGADEVARLRELISRNAHQEQLRVEREGPDTASAGRSGGAKH
jgi:catechol 2,3-dioxygenase-like lactoylglutathione lyase family enzyme